MQRLTDLEGVIFTEQPLEKVIQFGTNDVSFVDRRVDVAHVLNFCSFGILDFVGKR